MTGHFFLHAPSIGEGVGRTAFGASVTGALVLTAVHSLGPVPDLLEISICAEHSHWHRPISPLAGIFSPRLPGLELPHSLTALNPGLFLQATPVPEETCGWTPDLILL